MTERGARVGTLREAGFVVTLGGTSTGECPRCPHPFDDHIALADFMTEVHGRPMPKEGRLICPDCDCLQTWGVTGAP